MCRACKGVSREEASQKGKPSIGVLNRRRFLKLSGAGIAAALFAGATGSDFAQAQSEEGSLGSESRSLLGEFRQAAEEYDLPLSLLVAIGYVNTRLTMPLPETSAYEEGEIHGYGIYGIMALVKNPRTNTVSEASEITGIPEDELMADRRSNILGGAALLAESVGEQRPQTLEGFLPVLAGRKNAKSPGGVGNLSGDKELFAEEVMEILKQGFAERTPLGESVAMEPTDPGRRLEAETKDMVKDRLPSGYEKSLGEEYAERIGVR